MTGAVYNIYTKNANTCIVFTAKSVTIGSIGFPVGFNLITLIPVVLK